ncbi:MAG: sigma 54-interacting transcriptional regulator [Acidobacteriota bacterium]|nr:sigma 54-interacting transcriptional regulator [Acidobacteriota bacterium]
MSQAPHDLATTRPRKGKPRDREAAPVPCLTILTHPLPLRIGDRCLLGGGRQSLALSRSEPDFKAPDRLLGAPLDDPFISRKPLRLAPTPSGDLVLHRDGSSTEVTLDDQSLAVSLHISRAELERGAVLTIAERVVLLAHLVVPRDVQGRQEFGILGFNDHIQHLRAEIRRVADLKTPVLLRGASGTGKELAAAAIHACGPPGRPFVCVNMAAIPPNLAASELFGAVKGSFTGANRDQLGYIRQAHGGTLFLDEVGETPAEVQVMLLRTLETGEVAPVGAQRAVQVETRLVAATDADLEGMMELESFKKPLFHRLAGYEICLPPLSQRKDDLGRLFLHFAREVLAETGELEHLTPLDVPDYPWLPASLMERLLTYHWPGNVRQLRNLTRQILIANRGREQLQLPPKIQEQLADTPSPTTSAPAARAKRKPSQWSEQEVIEVMESQRWDIKASAAVLGISRGSLYSLIRKSGRLCMAGDLDRPQLEESIRLHGGDIRGMVDHLRVSEGALRKRINDLGLCLEENGS